jgi:threonine 3-dehydrogenase
MAKAIVFGAGGQVAADLVPMLYDRGDDLTLVDLYPPDETEGGKACRRYFETRRVAGWERWWRAFDATDNVLTHRLIRELRPDVVYHLAAILSARCEDAPPVCWRINMALFTNVLEDLRLITAGDYRPKLLFPSSIAAFGPLPGAGVSYEPDNEYPLLPTTMYGVTKVACETLGTYYADKRWVDFRAVRYPGLLNDAAPGGGSSDYANQMYFDAVDGAEPRPCFVGPGARIPFMYMKDAARALIQLAEADGAMLTRRVYNIKAFAAPSAAEMAASIAREVPGFSVRYEPDRRAGYVASWPDDLDDRPARNDWGWQAEVNDLDKMTRRLLADIRAKRRVQPNREEVEA